MSQQASDFIDDYYKYVHQYRKAADAMSGLGEVWPVVLVRGVLVELALKTYLCARGIVGRNYGEPGHGHKLNALARLAMAEGLVLTDRDVNETIRNLHKDYSWHDELGEDHLCRFPMPNRPTTIHITPGHAVVDDMVERVISQSRACPPLVS